jgi:hypothetical protein
MAANNSTAQVGSIPKIVDPKMTITTAEQALDLERAFDKEFGPLHEVAPEPEKKPEPQSPELPGAKESAAPPKEEPPPAKETEPSPELKPEPKAPPAEPTTHPDDESDDELDQIRLHQDSRPETMAAFRRVRGMLKTEKKAAKELRERVEAQEKELLTHRGAVRPVSDPTVQKELDDLRSFHSKHQVFDDSGYQVQYEQPVHTLFDDIIKDVKGLAGDPAAAAEWEKEIRGAGPDRLDRAYWNEGVISQCQDPLHRERLIRKIGSLLEAQEKRNEFRSQMEAEPNAYNKFRQQQAADYWQNFSVEAEDEAKKLIPTMGDWAAPKDLAMAKTAQERAAFEAHNNVYKEYETVFQRAITDAATQGPRGMTRVAVQAVMAERYRRDLEAANTKMTKLQAELKAAQDELNKISSARSRVNNSTGSSTIAAGMAPRKRLGQSAEDAVREHFGTT